MTTYLLRGLDAELWRAVKTRAAREGHTVRWVIVTLLTRYVRAGLPK